VEKSGALRSLRNDARQSPSRNHSAPLEGKAESPKIDGARSASVIRVDGKTPEASALITRAAEILRLVSWFLMGGHRAHLFIPMQQRSYEGKNAEMNRGRCRVRACRRKLSRLSPRDGKGRQLEIECDFNKERVGIQHQLNPCACRQILRKLIAVSKNASCP
jgi:hypothetical protein